MSTGHVGGAACRAPVHARTPAVAVGFARHLPCAVERAGVGNASTGMVNVVVLGPQFAARYVSPYTITKPAPFALSRSGVWYAAARMMNRIVSIAKPPICSRSRPILSMV
jgi:hypothetical protein